MHGPAYRAFVAHGFGIRYDLPVPLAIYMLGAGAVLVITFGTLGLWLRSPVDDLRYPRLVILRQPRRIVPAVRAIAGACGVGGLVFVIAVGFLGARDPTGNPAEYLVWIYFWAGLIMLSAVVGNLFAVLNPWSALHDAVTALGWGSRAVVRDYPTAWGMWPAVLGYLAFAWFELASGLSANPRLVATAALAYSVYTLAAIRRYGKERWTANGEVFSVLFHFVGAFAPVEVVARTACGTCRAWCRPEMTSCRDCGECFTRAADREVALRPWSVGLWNVTRSGWDIVTLVILMLGSLAFDGFSATPPWFALTRNLGGVDAVLGPTGWMVVRTAGLVVVSLLFLGVFAVVVRLVRHLSGTDRPLAELATCFAYTLVPIALVYNAAHYYSYVVIQGQNLWPLLGDPLQRGVPAHLDPSFAWTDAAFVWWLQVALIVAGHVLAVVLAHGRARRLSAAGARTALRGQYPMMLLMITYTATSLWILSQPITESG